MTDKLCPKCGVVKSIDEFGSNKSHNDGHATYCIPCNRKYSREYNRTYRQEGHYDATRFYTPWSDEKKEKRRQYEKSNPLKYHARKALSKAIERGKIIPPDQCSECGKYGKVQGHHHNGYEKAYWLDVVFICAKCHGKYKMIED